MKKLLVSIAIAAFIFSASAQEKREMKRDKGAMHQRHNKGHKKEMMKDLNLTDAQKAQMKANMQESRNQMKELKQNDKITVKEMKEKRKALHDQQKAKMQALLTAEQKSKLEASKANMQAKRSEMDAKRMEEMKTKLSLSNEQAAKLKAHNESVHARLKTLKDDQSLSAEAKKQQMKAIKDAAKVERKNILTAEQLKKMEEWRKEGKREGGKKEWKDSKK